MYYTVQYCTVLADPRYFVSYIGALSPFFILLRGASPRLILEGA